MHIGLQVLCSEPSTFPPDPRVAAGEQGLQSLRERRHKAHGCIRVIVLDLIEGTFTAESGKEFQR